MKSFLFLVGALAIGMSGCQSEQPVANVQTPEIASDESSYCFVGMD